MEGRHGTDPASEALLAEGISLIEGATERGIPLRLMGGLAIRYLCPHLPPRTRVNQDLDMATVGSAGRPLAQFLTERGYAPDKTFNSLYGHKQMFFRQPDGGTAVDVLVDRAEMCHVVEFKERIDRMPVTLDVLDLLLSKLQIVQLNAKDAQDVVYLITSFPVETGDAPGTIGLDAFRKLMGSDWGWWRTVTLNLEKIGHLLESGEVPQPAEMRFPADRQLAALLDAANDAPKNMRWKVRSKVGERAVWYQTPEETDHY